MNVWKLNNLINILMVSFQVEEKSSLLIENVDTNTDENRKRHHTDEYEDQGLLVVRRGDSVKFSLTFNRVPEEQEELWLRLAHGNVPKISDGTLVELTSEKGIELDGEWRLQKSVETNNNNTNKIEYDLHIPADASVAKYNLSFDSWMIENGKYVKKSSWPKPGKPKVTMVILFNPWCPEDQVYLADADEREEYVMNDHGRIWGRACGGYPWYFAQFEEECYEVALDILSIQTNGSLSTFGASGRFENLGDAALICRKLSHLVPFKILCGKWEGPYFPHHRPTEWTGSQKILKIFRQYGDNVKYAQCWVFSAVCTTLCRALGIPCRTVTNFESAHDTDRSVTIDTHFDFNGKPMEYLNRDSVWNFHVWNEAWMMRRDLPDGYDGWQAFDGTPQEESEIGRTYACGPCPVQAIKEGNLHIPYDGKFIFAEVNGDRCTWIQNARGRFNLHRLDSGSIGTSVVTKGVGKRNNDGVELK
jgi:transglutaminase 1